MIKQFKNSILLSIYLFCALCSVGFSFSDTTKLNNETVRTNKSLDFFVIGDWGKGDNNQRNVANAMAIEATQKPIDFIVSVGDNFYPHGVRSINDKRWKNTFENMYADTSLRRDWYTAIGNHDYEGSISAQLRYHKKNPRWKTTQRYFSLTKAIPQSKDSVLFVFIDTNPFDKGMNKLHGGLWRQNKKKQLLWLEKVLDKSSAKWKIVIGHHPLFTTGFRRGKTTDIQVPFQPIFEKYKVDVYFSGHDHDLQHQKPDGHTHYFVSGAGSEFRGVTSDSDMTKFAKGDYGFMRAKLTSDTIEVFVINAKNNQLYNVKTSKK